MSKYEVALHTVSAIVFPEYAPSISQYGETMDTLGELRDDLEELIRDSDKPVEFATLSHNGIELIQVAVEYDNDYPVLFDSHWVE